MGKWWAALAAAWLSTMIGCGDNTRLTHDASIDGQTDAMIDAGLSCDDLLGLWWTRQAALDRSCAVDMDCALVGQPVEPTCNCDPVLACNVAANAEAYATSEALLMEQEIVERCEGTYGICDCFPTRPQCQDGGCTAPYRACF